ncbi:MAG: hypothetical protein ACREVL_02500, partial [Solimonas sp.]
YDQTTWYVNFGNYEAGVGALGGGNIDIAAGGDIRNLSVSIPDTGRVTGNTQPGEAVALHQTGGGNLDLSAGGNIEGGAYYIADGLAQLKAGGAFVSGSKATAAYPSATVCEPVGYGCYIHVDAASNSHSYDVYTMLFTSSGEFRLQSGGDLNIDSVMDPLMAPALQYRSPAVLSYTPDAKVSLFSAGGDVRIWNNGMNIDVAAQHSGPGPVFFYGTVEGPATGASGFPYELWPATVSAVAAAGDVRVLGGMMLAPAATGNLELLAKGNVYIGYGTQADDAYQEGLLQIAEQQNYRSGRSGIYMSQAHYDLLKTPINPTLSGYGYFSASAFENAGAGNVYPGVTVFSLDHLPDLHAGDATPVRIYAADGDVVTTAQLNFPKEMWVQAGRHVYFPAYTIQHNSVNDLSLVRAGGGLYFSTDGYISTYGPGRLEIETGGDLWIPDNARGITSNPIGIYPVRVNPNQSLPAPTVWKPDEDSADIAISVGYNQTPNYGGFEDGYLNPETAADMADYLLQDSGDGRKLSIYLFDRVYQRADQGTDGRLVTSPALAQGFVNYVRSLQGLPALQTTAEQNAYLGQAWNFWLTLPSTQKTP